MTQPLSTRRAVLMVADREFRTRARTKASVIGTVVVLAILLIALVAYKIFGTGDDEPTRIGLVAEAAQIEDALLATAQANDVDVELSVVESREAATTQVEDGDLDVALVPEEADSVTAVVESELDDVVGAVITSVVRQAAVDSALVAEGVDPQVVAQAAESASVSVDALDPPDPEEGQRAGIAYIVVLVLYLQLFIFGLNVATGVVEEKVSRVVEILLATIRPLQLLMGKVLGIGAVGLVQLALFAVVGFGTAIALDLITVTGTAIATGLIGLLWFVLGYLLFALLYAAAASLVSRQEDVNAVTTPINFLIIGMFILAQQAVFNPGGALADVLGWIPPFSAILMPLLVATNETSGVQIVLSVVLMLAAIGLAWVVAARVYENAILRTGARVKLKDVLSRPSAGPQEREVETAGSR